MRTNRLIVAAILIFPVALLAYWVNRGVNLQPAMPQDNPQFTIADRLQQYGPSSRARLKPFFDAAQISYPPARLVLLGLKQEKILQVYAAGTNQSLRFIHAWPVLAASGKAGPKLQEGDQQVPEGIYPVDFLNPNSKFHLSLRLGYPNQFDRDHAKLEDRSDLGGDIMIHGGASSVGCLAMGDDAAQDLFVLAADTGVANITVILSPVDFRKSSTSPDKSLPAWTDSLYQTLKAKLNELPPPQ